MLPEEGKLSYIGRIVSLYELQDGAKFVQTSWFYRPEETLLGRQPTDGRSLTAMMRLAFHVHSLSLSVAKD